VFITNALKKELELRNIYSSELLVPLKYKGHELESKKCDLFIENALVVELNR
jgi:hypothetical protein